VAKPTSLTPDTLTDRRPSPRAATSPRSVRPAKRPANDTPLQLRLPRTEARAIKVAAAQSDQSISQFMLACFHARMQNRRVRPVP
jgi:hypothetical protein